MAMNSHRSAPRITDVVPANFLCDSRTMERIAQSQMKDEKALCAVEDNLSALESRQRCLKDELATVEGLISDAVAEQTRLRCSIVTHRSLLAHSPVRALPGEVLSEILLHYIALSQPATTSVFKQIVASHRIHTPILLVCRRWRTTALADARLWTTIPLVGSGGEETTYAHPLISGSPGEQTAYWNALQSKIERTSALPLHLLFHFSDLPTIADPVYALPSLQTFIRLFSRAESISVHIENPVPLIPELKSIIDSADIPHADGVHTARLDVYCAQFRRKILSAIPNVEVLQVASPELGTWFIDAPTAGHCLRSLDIPSGRVALVHILDLLDRAPLLETLKIRMILITSTVGILRVVTHMRLSTFHLEFGTPEENDAVFSHLTLPALRSLLYGDWRHDGASLWPRPSNMAFLQRSGCMLHSLAFSQCYVDEKLLMEMLTTQQGLFSLQLNCVSDSDRGVKTSIPTAILDFLSSDAQAGSDLPLPALTFLTVVIHPRQVEAVKRVIESRSAEQAKKCRIAALREVDIRVQRGQWEEESDDGLDKGGSDDSSDDIVVDEAYFDEIQLQKDDYYAAQFKDFVGNGVGLRIAYERV